MRHLLLVAVAASAALLVGCPVSEDRSCEALATCTDGLADASSDAAGDASGPPDTASPDDAGHHPDAALDSPDTAPPACNTALDPKAAPCVVDEGLGVFVSPTGSDTTGDGTKAKPYASITKAAAAPKAGMLRAFVCAGTYKDAAIVTAAADGLAVYGGLDCATWAYSTANKVLVAPTAHGPALSVTGIATGLTVEDIDFVAQAGTAAGESSIGGLVSGSTGVTLARVGLTAGAGMAGAAGKPPATTLPVAEKGKDAADAPASAGGAATTCVCPFGPSSVGGKGGEGGATATDGDNGTPNGAVNKGATSGAACTVGTKGNDAVGSAPNGAGAMTSGSLSGTAWTPSPGQKGSPGATGQGGGGGGGATGAGNGGGGGGCGGCGGDGGGFGAGGGSSIPLLAVNSTGVALSDSRLASGNGGAGGAGAGGQTGTDGGKKGLNINGVGCAGGPGGIGGQGGPGGGGAGGVSVGIAYKGAAPTLDATTEVAIVTGAAGAGGIGGKPGTNDGIPGVKQAKLAL